MTRMPILTALGLDYGTRHLGVARLRGSSATPEVIITSPHVDTAQTNDFFIQELKAILESNPVNVIVLGISEATTAQLTRDFSKLISQQLKLPCIEFDETLSSWEAAQLPLGQKRLAQRQPIDDIAAAIILEEWLASGTPGWDNALS